MEAATALLASMGMVLYLGFVLGGAALLLSVPVIGLAGGVEQVYRARRHSLRAGTTRA